MFVHRLLVNNLTIGSKKQIQILNRISYNQNHEISTTTINYGSFKDESPLLPGAFLMHIKRSLKLANVEYQDGVTNLKTSCPACDCKEGTKAEDIFINKTTGHFMCPTCRFGGKVGLIEKFFTTSRTPKTINELKTYQNLFLEVKEKYQKTNAFDFHFYEENYKLVTETDADLICNQFEIDEKIPRKILVTLQARYNETKKELLFPLADIQGNIVGCKIITKKINEDGEWVEISYPESNCSGLIMFNNSKPSKAKDPANNAVLVLNMLDLFALMTTKINATYICLPYGLKHLPQECLPLLDQFSELTLWFNFNIAGWDVAKNFAKKLDEKRCKFVRPTSKNLTPYKALENHTDIKGIYSKSLPILHKAITTFHSLRQDVLSDLQNIDKVQGVKWKRFPILNKYLKGHRKGELTLLTGPTGSGKTTFMSDYSLDLAMQGVTTLWGSFEIRNARLATTLLRQFAGKPLLESITDANLLEFDNYANQFETLPIYFMTFHGEQMIKVVMEAIEHALYVHDIHHVIIDNVQFMMGMGEDSRNFDRFWNQDVIISAFRTFATKKNCHVTLVIHPRKEKENEDLTTNSIFGGAKATQEADNVLIIQDKRLTSIRGKKYLQIAKNRYSGDLGIMPLEFDKQSLSYAQRPKKKIESNDQPVPSSDPQAPNESPPPVTNQEST